MATPHSASLRRIGPGTIYYGWYIVAAAIIAQMMAMGLQSYAMSVFLKPMTAEFGWSREDFANVQTIGTFVSGGLGFFLGTLIDHRGSRPLMIGGALISGACMIGISRVNSLPEFYLLRGIGFTIGAMGIGNLVVNVTVSKWFVRHRGMAVAIAATGISLGGVIMTPVTQALVTTYGWRDTWVILGIAVWMVIIPTAFVMRRSPEDHGLLPDGDSPAGAHGAARTIEESWTRREAIRTRAIWLLIFAWGFGMVGIGALMLHMVSFLTDGGFSAATAAFLFSLQAWAALVSKPLWGLVMGRVQVRFLGAAGFVCAGLAVLGLLAAVGQQAMLLTAVMLVLFGFAIGGTVPLQETVWATYYGRTHLGQIRSVGIPFTILFSALGPKFAAQLYDRAGNYTAAFLIFACFWLVSAALILLARPPRRRVRTPLPDAAVLERAAPPTLNIATPHNGAETAEALPGTAAAAEGGQILLDPLPTLESLVRLFGGTADGVYVVDGDQRIVAWTPPAERLLGWSAGEVVGRRCYEVIQGCDEEGVRICRRDCAVVVCARGGQRVPSRDLLTDGPGRRVWINVSTVVVGVAGVTGPVAVHLFRDARRRRWAESLSDDAIASAAGLPLNGQPLAAPECEAASEGCPTPLAPHLTPRELEVLRLLAAGRSVPDIANSLVISGTTVRNHIGSMMAKLGAHNRLQAVLYATQHNLLETASFRNSGHPATAAGNDADVSGGSRGK